MRSRCVVAALLLAGLPAQERLAFAKVFGDGMVLQRDRELPIRGRAEPNARLELRFGDVAVSTEAAADGTWLAVLPPQPASREGRELRIRQAAVEAVLRDVLVGDVWLCSGQSNMAMGLDSCGVVLPSEGVPSVRFRPYFEHFAAEPQRDLREGAAWLPVRPPTAGGATAVGVHFAQALRGHTDVPIGLLECTVGGTEIECWMPPAAVAEFPANRAVGERLQQAIAEWQTRLATSLPEVEAWTAAARAAAAAGRALPNPPSLPPHPNEDRNRWVRTHSLWNGMVAPMTQLPIAGVLWYQGENNAAEDHAYADKLRALVTTWRRAWNRELPFYAVQLPNWGARSERADGGDLGFAPCRMGQLRCIDLPRFGLAVAIDVGDPADLHPRDKRAIGARLARWALRDVYGVDIVPSGPLFAAAEAHGGAMHVRFLFAAGGLSAREGADVALRGFAVAGPDRVWHHAEARILGDLVSVANRSVPSPVAVRYSYTANPDGNLVGIDGLPAAPFRSDSW